MTRRRCGFSRMATRVSLATRLRSWSPSFRPRYLFRTDPIALKPQRQAAQQLSAVSIRLSSSGTRHAPAGGTRDRRKTERFFSPRSCIDPMRTCIGAMHACICQLHAHIGRCKSAFAKCKRTSGYCTHILTISGLHPASRTYIWRLQACIGSLPACIGRLHAYIG
jgi:hypothetical protein